MNLPFFFVSDNEEANQMKPYFHLRKPRSTNEAQRTKKKVAGTRNGTARVRSEERVARYDKACKKLTMTLGLSQWFIV